MFLRLLPPNLGPYSTSVFDPPSRLKSGSQKSALIFFFFYLHFSVSFFFFCANFVLAQGPSRSSLNSHGTPWSCTSCESQLKIVIARSPSNTRGQDIWLTVSVGCGLLPFLRVNCSVTLDQLRHHTTSCLQQRSDVRQQKKRFVGIDGSVPIVKKNSWIIVCSMGLRGKPRTWTTSCTLRLSMPPSQLHLSTGPLELSMFNSSKGEKSVIKQRIDLTLLGRRQSTLVHTVF